jgi:putative spermidine/putrescine transport system permease protein
MNDMILSRPSGTRYVSRGHIKTYQAKLAACLPQIAPVLCLVPLLLMLALFTFAPLVWILHSAVSVEGHFSLARFGEILTSSFYRQAFGNSLYLASGSSLAGLTIAALTASSLRRVGGRLRNFVLALTNMTSNMAGVPLAFAFIVILGTNGAITLMLRQGLGIEIGNLYSMHGLLLIYTYFQIPLALLMLYPAFDALNDEWQEAAALLGASRRHYWWHVGLPILLPPLLGTFILLFANAMGAYASAFALTSGNFNLLTIRIASLVSGDLFLEPETAAALSVLLMGLLAAMTWANQKLLRRVKHAR